MELTMTQARPQLRETSDADRSVACRTLLGLLLAVGMALAGAQSALAQTCPEPWASASAVYGTITLHGNGTASNDFLSQKTQQSASVAAKMEAQAACLWFAAPSFGFGSDTDPGTITDSITEPCSDSDNLVTTFSANGVGSAATANLSINGTPTTYSFGAGDILAGTESIVGCGSSYTANVNLSWGPVGGFPQNIPITSSSAVLSGSTSFKAQATTTDTLPANWDLTWNFTPTPDDTDKCQGNDPNGSTVGCRNQSLGEDIAIVGTPFSLHYESSRALGRAGADTTASYDAHGLGGWTLSVHHALQPLLQFWCIGGSCTPYAVTPKALFLGNGETRSDSEVQAGLSWNGNYLVTSEDGSEIYVFTAGLHTQTLAPLTGAVIYSFGYDLNNQLVTVTDGNGNVTTIQRDANEHPTAIIAPFGQKTTVAVDANGYLSRATDPLGHATKLTTSSLGLLTKLVDPNGNLHTFQYDMYGRLTKDLDPAGGSITLARADSPSGYVVTKTTAMGTTSTYQEGFSSSSSQSSQQFTNTWTSGLQSSLSQTQSLGQISSSTTFPDGSAYSETLGPDPVWGIQAPVITSQTVVNGGLTMARTAHRATTLSVPGNPFTVASQTDTEIINGRTYSSAFAGTNLTYVDTTPVGRILTTTLDSQERLSSMQLGTLAAFTFAYDSRGRLASAAQGTRKTIFSYNPKGFLASTTDPLKLKTSYTYDADGHLSTATLPDGRVVTYAYDANGNLTSITPPGESPHEFVYSTVDLPTTYTPPTVSGTGPSTYSYDLDRKLTAVSRPDGQAINYGYDTAGRLASIATPTGTSTFTYNATTGSLTSAARGSETVGLTYNGPLLTKSTWKGTVAGSVSRAYNNNFWITSQGVGGGTNVTLKYDNDGLLTQAGMLTIKRNSSHGLITSTAQGVATDSRTYNTFGELITYTASVNGSTVYKVQYTRDADGRVIAKSEIVGGATNTYSYSYDPTRLTAATKNTATNSYAYDTNSNRLSATTASGTAHATYDAQDRLLTYGSASFTYSANGELTSQKIGTQKTTYKYDVLGNLISVTLPGGAKLAYVVDAANRRVGKSVNGVLTTGFLYDDDHIVAQLNGSNQLVSQFVYATGSAAPDFMMSDGATYRIFSDQLGSPVLVVDTSTGAIAEQITYDEFGNVLIDTNPGFQPFAFAGGLYDQDTKLVRFGARDYNPSVGRWTAKDPILLAGGDTNLYGYILEDPINDIDPAGLAPGRGQLLSSQTVRCKCPDYKVGYREFVVETHAGDKPGSPGRYNHEEFATGYEVWKEIISTSPCRELSWQERDKNWQRSHDEYEKQYAQDHPIINFISQLLGW